MKVPVSWLKQYVDFEDSLEGLSDKLTFSGVEVEGIETVGGGLEDLIVGEVRTVEKHPNADRLSLCRVFDGTEEHQVVCGAPNVVAGMKTAFAPVGSVLPGDFKLKKAKIRGVESFGMLCAEDELGLSESHDGIMVLNPDSAPGTPLTTLIGPPETVFELEITPNRPDCLSLIGLAREVAALYETSLSKSATEHVKSTAEVAAEVSVSVEDAEDCPRYTARVLHNIKIKPSPDWMQRRLTLSGIRPINNVVDITNYVLLETGHPLHAFDKTLVKDGQIIVRRAQPGERMTTLDGIERELDENILVIADANAPIALAGVMGGAGSEINDNTTSVLLEAATFNTTLIRATSKKLGLRSESSYRFERGVDATSVDYASERAVQLLIEFADAQPVNGILDVCARPAPPHEIVCRYERVRRLYGVDLEPNVINEVFESIELEIVKHDDESCTVRVPTFRRDLEREVDLIEEVARLHGLEHIPIRAPRGSVVPGASDVNTRALQDLHQTLIGLGLQEIANYSLISADLQSPFETTAETRITLPNPISQDQSILRKSLLPQLLESLGRNHSRQVSEAALYEVGRVYEQRNDNKTEQTKISIGLMGPGPRQDLEKRQTITDEEMFAWMSGCIAALLQKHQIENWSLEETQHPGLDLAVNILQGTTNLGVLGLASGALLKKYRFASPVAIAEIKAKPLLKRFQHIQTVKPVALQPALSRDIAMLVNGPTTNAEIQNIISAAAPKELEKIELFDIFSEVGMGDGRKSMAYSLTYRSSSKTLTDEEANLLHESVKSALKKNLAHVELREG